VPLSATHFEESYAAIEITQIKQNSRSQYSATAHIGIIEVARNTPQADGTWDANLSSKTSKEISTTSDDRSHAEFRSGTVIQNSRSSFTAPGTDTVGVTIQIDNRGNADGTVDAKLDSRTSRTMSATSGQLSAGLIELESVTKNSHTQFDPSASLDAGIIEVVGNTPNNDGTFDAKRSSRTSLSQTAVGGQMSEGLVESSTIIQNSRSSVDLSATVAVGVIEIVGNRPNVDGSVDVSIQSRTAISQTATGGQVSVGTLESTTTIQNSATAADAPSGTATDGVIETVSNRKNVDGSVDVSLSSKTSRPLSSTGMQAAAGLIELDTITRNSATQVSATNETGVIQVARNTRQDDGTYDVNLSSKTSISQTAAGATLAAGYTESSTVITSSHTSGTVSTTATPGVVETVANTPNLDGTVDIRLNSRTALSQTGSGGHSASGYTESSTILLNSSREISGTAGLGVIEVWSNRPNQDGSIDASLQSRTALPQSTTVLVENFFDIVSRTDLKNSSSAITSATGSAGVVELLDDNVNPDGTHNITVASSTELSRTSGEFVSKFQNHSSTEYLFKNSATIPALVGDYGQVHATWTPGGLYAGGITELTYDPIVTAWPSESGTTISRVFWMFRRYSNTNWRRSSTVNITFDFHGSYKNALEATDGGATGFPCEQSGVVAHGRRYKSTSVGNPTFGEWVVDVAG